MNDTDTDDDVEIRGRRSMAHQNQKYVTLILITDDHDDEARSPAITWDAKRVQTIMHRTKVLEHRWSGDLDDFAWLAGEMVKWTMKLHDDDKIDLYERPPFFDFFARYDA